MKKKSRGGARKGAGRPRNKHKKQFVILACSNEEKALILKFHPNTRLRALALIKGDRNAA